MMILFLLVLGGIVAGGALTCLVARSPASPTPPVLTAQTAVQAPMPPAQAPAATTTSVSWRRWFYEPGTLTGQYQVGIVLVVLVLGLLALYAWVYGISFSGHTASSAAPLQPKMPQVAGDIYDWILRNQTAILLIIVFVLAALIWFGKWPWFLGPVAILLLLILVWPVVGPFFTGSDYRQLPRLSSPLICDGQWRTGTLSATPLLTTGSDRFSFTFDVQEGAVLLMDPVGNTYRNAITPGFKGNLNFPTAKWRAAGPLAVINVRCFRT